MWAPSSQEHPGTAGCHTVPLWHWAGLGLAVTHIHQRPTWTCDLGGSAQCSLRLGYFSVP